MIEQSGLLLGIDLGSSSVKVAVVDAVTGLLVAQAQVPETEMRIDSPRNGWAEQHPERWWEYTCQAIQLAMKNHNPADLKAIGISYQMHGLVCLDQIGQVVRPAIIWCDSRAIETGTQISNAMGSPWCNDHLLNQPGNFTFSKLVWVKENEPYTYRRIKTIMLPGDYLAFRLTGKRTTTATGLSEGTMYDYKTAAPAWGLFQRMGIAQDLIPEIVPSLGFQGETMSGLEECRLPAGIALCYRAGDQPNNAVSLNVLEPGEFAATAGTSGVIYGVSDKPMVDSHSRINSFLHVNSTSDKFRCGVLLCINGTGILYSWIKRLLGAHSYEELNAKGNLAPAGSEGVYVLPFGNGAERVLGNKTTGGQWLGIDFNRHSEAHLIRASMEGIVFALNYGLEVFRTLGMNPGIIKAGDANLFRSELFRQIFVNTTGVELEILATDGASGAARAAGSSVSSKAVSAGVTTLATYQPNEELINIYAEEYIKWKEIVNKTISNL